MDKLELSTGTGNTFTCEWVPAPLTDPIIRGILEKIKISNITYTDFDIWGLESLIYELSNNKFVTLYEDTKNKKTYEEVGTSKKFDRVIINCTIKSFPVVLICDVKSSKINTPDYGQIESINIYYY